MSESLDKGFNKHRVERGETRPLTPEEEYFNNGLVALGPGLMPRARSLTNNKEEAKDLVQETLQKALQSREQFKAGTNLGAWVNTILTRTSIDWRRRHNSRMVDRGEKAEIIIDNMASPSDHVSMLALHRTIGRIDTLLNNLPARQREALGLAALGYSEKEIAAKTGASQGTVKTSLSRGRNTLKDKLK